MADGNTQGGERRGRNRTRFSAVPEELAFLDKSGLSPRAVVLWITLDRYLGRNEVAWPSRSTLARHCGCSVKTVDRLIAELVEAGWIEVERRPTGRGMAHETNLYSLVDEPVAGVEGRDTGVARGRDTGVARGRDTGVPQKEPQENDHQENENPPYIPPQDADSVEVATVDRPEAPAARIRQVFDHWLARRLDYALDERQPRLTPPRRAAINARLHDGYTVAELCDAIDGVLDSDWHRTHGHTDLTAIMRPRKVDAHITRATDRRAQENRRAQEWADAGAAMDRVMGLVNAERERTR